MVPCEGAETEVRARSALACFTVQEKGGPPLEGTTSQGRDTAGPRQRTATPPWGRVESHRPAFSSSLLSLLAGPQRDSYLQGSSVQYYFTKLRKQLSGTPPDLGFSRVEGPQGEEAELKATEVRAGDSGAAWRPETLHLPPS